MRPYSSRWLPQRMVSPGRFEPYWMFMERQRESLQLADQYHLVDATIKYESPSNHGALLDLQSSLKRQRSEEHVGDKRQKIETVSEPSEHDLSLYSAALPVDQSTPSTYLTPNPPEATTPQSQPISTLWDPHLNMRLNSLNILESLVCNCLYRVCLKSALTRE